MEYGHFHPIPKGMQLVAGGKILSRFVPLFPHQSLPKTPLRINTTSVQPPPPPPQITRPSANEQGDFFQPAFLSWFPKDLGL